MRTLKGYEAIQVAEQYDALLYDLENRNEVSVAEAREYIERRRDPDVFVLNRWPDTDEEADKIVLQEFQSALLERRTAQASLFEISIHLSGGLPIHPEAAELAADRLVKQGKLDVVETRDNGDIYRIPHNLYFKRSFLDQLRKKVCPDCAHLDIGGAYHEVCLMNLVQYIQENHLTAMDIVETRQSSQPALKLTRTIRPSSGIQWLSQRANATRQKWQSVLKPIFSQDPQRHDTPDGQKTLIFSAPQTETAKPSVHRTEENAAAEPMVDLAQRTKITKNELIGYLRAIEIVDENGELGKLRQERDALLQEIAMKQEEIERVEKQRAYAEKQYQEVQRDMDVVLEAMKIAKRHTPNPVHVIDATYESSNKDET